MNTSKIIKPEIDADFLMWSAMDRIRQLEAEVKRLQVQNSSQDKCIRILQGSRLIRVPLVEIIFIRAESNYSRIFLKNGIEYFTSKTLKSWAQEIKDADFLRCHRSFLINKQEIVEVNRHAYHIVMRNGEEIPVSRRSQKNCVTSLFQNEDREEKNPIPKPRCTVHKLKLTGIPTGK